MYQLRGGIQLSSSLSLPLYHQTLIGLVFWGHAGRWTLDAMYVDAGHVNPGTTSHVFCTWFLYILYIQYILERSPVLNSPVEVVPYLTFLITTRRQGKRYT
ncbi:hypothetical protein F4815DRAFT_455930 [Daldinia loculata]|nr:hypothetical protein F4815DRAFT_455930 [Daldinia loculata]